MSEGQSFVRSTRGLRRGRVILVLALAAALTACSDNLTRAYEEGQRAEALLQQGDLPAAREAIGRALALRDDQVALQLLDARIKLAMQDPSAAYDAYAFILALDPNNPEALLGVAQLGLSTGRIRESREAAGQILAIEPGQPDALLIEGIHEINAGKYDAALALGEKLIQSAPGDPRGVVLKARSTFLLGRHEESFALLREATVQLGNNDMIATALLENAREQGDVAVMLEQLSLLRQARPGSIDLAIDEANIRYKSGNVPGARTVGSEIIAQFGSDAGAMTRLADLWIEYDPDPLDVGQRNALAAGGPFNARLAAARHYFQRGELAVAGELVAAPGDDRTAALGARVAFAQGSQGAVNGAAAILQRDRTNCDALATVAEADLRRGRAEAAIVGAQVLAAECRDRTDGFVLQARAYAAQDRFAGVERVYREGIAVHPLDRPLAARFVEWLFDRGRNEAAVSAARRLAQRGPAKISSWQLLAAACRRVEDARCERDARAGEELARRTFAMDLPPGGRRVNPLFGQTWR